MATDSACAIIVGNEVLTAKIADANGPLLARRLRARGVPLCAVHTVPDDVDAIVEALALARRRARWIITSGGIGPTHDDVTVRAVALALGRRVVRLPEMEALIRDTWQVTELTPAALRLAEAPEGATLVGVPGAHFPVLCCDGIFMLPGVPKYFALQLEAVLATLPLEPLTLRCLFLSAHEHEIAQALDAVALENAHVAIGSYPVVEPDACYRVKLTIEHVSADEVAKVLERLKKELPEGSVISEEEPKRAG